MYFRTKPWMEADDGLGYRLSTVPTAGQGLIEILSAETWLFLVPEQALSLPLWNKPGYWDFEATDTEGNVYTFWRGTIKSITDSTR